MNDALPTPPSSPQSHAVNSTHSNLDTPLHTPNGMDIDSNEADLPNSASPKQNLSHLSSKTPGHTMTALPLNPTLHSHTHSQALTPLGTYPYPPPTASQSSSPARGSNLLHSVLPDLNHHPLSGLYSPASRSHLPPVHHTHDHHHHHHIAPPFLYPPYTHPAIVSTNPYMPAIDVSSSSNTKLSSITMPTIDNDNNINMNTTLTKKQKRKAISDSNSSSSSSSSSMSTTKVVIKNKEQRKNKIVSEVDEDEEDDEEEEEEEQASSISSANNDDGDSDYQNPEEIMSESSENVQIKKRFRKKDKLKSVKTSPPKKKKRKKKRHKLMIESESQNDDDDEDEYSDDNEKSLTGVWVVYYSWDIIRDTDMTKPRYEMELKQHKGGNIEGKCIEDSGPAAWTFLLTGKLEKGKTFKYTMYGEDDEIFGKATFDGKDIIKNGMWYRDRLYLRKGGSLVAARKGTQLPRALMQKTDIKKMAKRKRDSGKKRDNLYSPPSKRQKKSHSRSVSPTKASKKTKRESLPTPPPRSSVSVSPKQQQQIYLKQYASPSPYQYNGHYNISPQQQQLQQQQYQLMRRYQSAGPVTTIDGRTVPPEPPPKQRRNIRKKKRKKNKVIVIDTSSHSDDDSTTTDESEELVVKKYKNKKRKNKKKIKERINKIKRRKLKRNQLDIGYKEAEYGLIPPPQPKEYYECDLSGAWSLYFDNSVNENAKNNKKQKQKQNKGDDTKTNVFEGSDLYNYYDEDDEPINNDTLFLCHNKDTNELSGFVCSPLKCHVTGHVSSNGIDVRIIMIWSPNKELGGQFAGYVTVINGEYDCDRGLNCEYCSFHCTSYFHTMLWRRFEQKLSKHSPWELSQAAKMTQFQAEVASAVEETKYNNSDYVAIVEKWFQDNEKDVSPGQIHSNKNNYSNQCIWRRRKLPYTKYSHIKERISYRKQPKAIKKKRRKNKVCPNNKYMHTKSMKIPLIANSNDKGSESESHSMLSKYEKRRKSNLSEFMIRDDRISKNQSPFFFGDFVQLFVTFESVLSHPLAFYLDSDEEMQGNDDSELEMDLIDCFGGGHWVDGLIMNVYESKVLVRYYYESALYQQWIDCDVKGAVYEKATNKNENSSERRVTIQPLIRLRQSLTISSHLNHILADLNMNALNEWRLRLNKSCVCFACDGNGNWTKAIIRQRFGCFVLVHWEHFDDDKHDQYISIHSQRIRPLKASDICNRFRSNLKFENVLRIKPQKLAIGETKISKPTPEKNKKSDERLDKIPKKGTLSNIFKCTVLHLVPE